MITQSFLESFLFVLGKSTQEVPRLFQQSCTGSGLPIFQLHSLHFFGRQAKIFFSPVLNPGYVNVVPYISNAETIFESCRTSVNRKKVSSLTAMTV